MSTQFDDFSNENPEVKFKAKERPFSEHDRLAFAKWILSIASLVYVGSGAVEIFCKVGQSVAASSVFESIKQIVPPIITLVLGYYFARGKI